MNRAKAIQTLAALDALRGALREALKAEAEAELEEQGTRAAWSTAGMTLSASITHDRCEVADEDAFMTWLVEHHPDWVMTVVVPRNPKQVQGFLASLAESGPEGPPLQAGQSAPSATRVPGVWFVKGGLFETVSLRFASSALKRDLDDAARVSALRGDELADSVSALLKVVNG